MKISYMKKRENFYQINKDTLDTIFAPDGRKTKLYVYPHINAIVTKRNSREIREYLLNEYSVKGNRIKRVLAKSYVVLCLISQGFLADKTVLLNCMVDDSVLIYPCNKKYRVFDFKNDIVSVYVKSGFPNNDLIHEIEFRKNSTLEFVPKLVSCNDIFYTERIIHGMPLARIDYGYDVLAQKAYDIFRSSFISEDRCISGKDYSIILLNRYVISQKNKKYIDFNILNPLINTLADYISKIESINLCFSHGDLQSGNIWIEQGTNQIFIIDWESWGERSIYYDKAVLFYSLRPKGISHFLHNISVPIREKMIVLFEDIIFQLNEYYSLPKRFGETEFLEYLITVKSYVDDNRKEINEQII